VEIELVVVGMMKVVHGAGRPSMTMIGEVEAEQEIELQEMMKRHHGRQLQNHLETEVTTVIMKLAWVAVVAWRILFQLHLLSRTTTTGRRRNILQRRARK